MSKKEYDSLADFVADNAAWTRRCIAAQDEAGRGNPSPLQQILDEVDGEAKTRAEGIDYTLPPASQPREERE